MASAQSYEKQYTKPKLRGRLKEEIEASSKGGRPGQWSARKAQLLAQEYEKQGGGYRRGKQAPQKSLEQWTAQAWQTVDGKGKARTGDGVERYLPEKAWALLSPAEQKKARRTKLERDGKGRQYAAWPKEVEKAMTAAGYTSSSPESLSKDELSTYAKRLGIRARSQKTKKDLAEALTKFDGRRLASRPRSESPVSKTSSGGGQKTYRDSTRTKKDLYEEAKRRDVPGRSSMSKAELARALND